MQGLGSFVESSPHWKQSKFIQTLLPYAPMATEFTKDTANKALSQIKSDPSEVADSTIETAKGDVTDQDDSVRRRLWKGAQTYITATNTFI